MDTALDLSRNGNVISIKDMASDLNINDEKWNFVFDFLLKQNSVVYFFGFRSWVNDDNNFQKILSAITEKIIVSIDNQFTILFKVKPAFVMINRGLLNNLWNWYEYPALFFLKDDQQEGKIIEYVHLNPDVRRSIFASVKQIYSLRRSFEMDVLWLEKSNDLSFPWNTTLSPLALESEAKKPWIEKLLNKLGFTFSIKIKRG